MLIWRIVNTKNGKSYVSKSKDMEEIASTFLLLKCGKFPEKKIQRAFNRNKEEGAFNKIEILIDTKETTRKTTLEYWINKFNSIRNGYNTPEITSYEMRNCNKNNKTAQRFYNKQFFSKFDSDIMSMGNKNGIWLTRMYDPYNYSAKEQRQVCEIIDWFYDNYYEDNIGYELNIVITKPRTKGAKILIDGNTKYFYEFGTINGNYVITKDLINTGV